MDDRTYVIADRDGTTVCNFYTGQTDTQIETMLEEIGCTNIRFVELEEWQAAIAASQPKP